MGGGVSVSKSPHRGGNGERGGREHEWRESVVNAGMKNSTDFKRNQAKF